MYIYLCLLGVTKNTAMLRCYIVTKAYLWSMTSYFIEEGNLLHMMQTLKMQMEGVRHTWNIYAHNAHLLAIATQSLSIELSLLNLLDANGRGECEEPWKLLDVHRWKEWLEGYDTGDFWDYEELENGDEIFPLPSDFNIFSTFIRHHALKELEEGRSLYDDEDDSRKDNAEALESALGAVGGMSPYYAAEVAEDAILQLGVTFAELERLMLENNPQATGSFMEERIKAGRKVVSCFLPEASTEAFKEAFRSFMKGISTEGGKVRLGHQEYDRKYVFVLLCYRFIRAGLMYRKLNVSCYSKFIVSALGLSVSLPSFRKSMNNWMQKIDLYGCTFEELTREQIRQKRFHEQQLTLDEYEVWCMVDQELDKALASSHAFDGFL